MILLNFVEILLFIGLVAAQKDVSDNINCSQILSVYEKVDALYSLRQSVEQKFHDKQNSHLKNLYSMSNIALEASKLLSPSNRSALEYATVNTYFEKLTSCLVNECKDKKNQLRCHSKQIYRSFDGTCSSSTVPDEGAAFTAYSRLKSPNYNDHVSEIRRSVTGGPLPLARKIVTGILLNRQLLNITDLLFIPNAASIMFGQLITHDVGSRQNHQPLSGGLDVRCCAKTGSKLMLKEHSSSACLSTEIPKNDSIFLTFGVTCQEFIRSQVVTLSGCPVIDSAQQVNGVTSLLDLSIVYDISKSACHKLRSFKDGQFKMTKNNYLTDIPGCTGEACYLVGDARANHIPLLHIWHLAWYREHNRIAKVLKTMNSFWSDETLFQETRRLVIAEYQHAVYSEYLPAYLSSATINHHMLAVDDMDFETVGHVDGRTTNEFAHGIFRRFHDLSPGTFNILDNNYKLVKSVKLADVIRKAKMIEKSHDGMIRGMLNQSMNTNTPDKDYSFRLFKDDSGLGIDLYSVDIQRGRDHGLAPYYAYRKGCGLQQVDTFKQLYPSISKGNIRKVRKIYKSVYDIDLIVGASLEEVDGGTLGPTMQCIMGDQFRRYKFGDPHFYTSPSRKYNFNSRQLEEIKKFTIARLFCDNSDIKVVPRNSFISPSAQNPMVSCKDIASINLNRWLAKQKVT